MDVVLCLASIAPNAEMTNGDISPTLMARAGTGGGQLPIVVLAEKESELNELSECNGMSESGRPSGQL